MEKITSIKKYVNGKPNTTTEYIYDHDNKEYDFKHTVKLNGLIYIVDSEMYINDSCIQIIAHRYSYTRKLKHVLVANYNEFTDATIIELTKYSIA